MFLPFGNKTLVVHLKDGQSIAMKCTYYQLQLDTSILDHGQPRPTDDIVDSHILPHEVEDVIRTLKGW